MLEIYMKNTS